MDKAYQIKIGDFGTAKSLEGTLANTVVGTIRYWSPETINFDSPHHQNREKIIITNKIDIW